MHAIAVCCLSTLLTNAEPAPIDEIWEVAHVEGSRVGFLHTTVRSLEGDGGKRLRATAELDLSFKRHNAQVRLRMEHGTDETADGKVVGVFMRQFHDKGQQLVLQGTVEDGRLHVKVDNGRIERRLRWSDDVVGVYRREHLFQQRKPKPGDQFSFPVYEPIVNAVVTVRVTVHEAEEVDVLGTRKSLLKVVQTPDKLETPGASVQLPPAVWWLDADFVPVRRQIELDGLGTVVLTRTTREVATAPGTADARVPDIGLKTLVPLNKTIARPHATRSAVYRITLTGDVDAGTALARDAHQEVKELHGNTFELHVHPAKPAKERKDAEAPAAEYLASCHFIDSDDARVRELARKAAGGETNPWKKAQRLERWVKQNMRPDNAAPFAPASQVARDLRGDCRLYAVLTAALCRAEGVPARTAVGLIYVEKGAQKPYMGFHMWTEVWADGQWLGLDGTLGQGGVGAAHVKIADHSWSETQSLTPFLPVSRILGKIGIEVLRTEAGD
jgi:hypothetical protein